MGALNGGCHGTWHWVVCGYHSQIWVDLNCSGLIGSDRKERGVTQPKLSRLAIFGCHHLLLPELRLKTHHQPLTRWFKSRNNVEIIMIIVN